MRRETAGETAKARPAAKRSRKAPSAPQEPVKAPGKARGRPGTSGPQKTAKQPAQKARKPKAAPDPATEAKQPTLVLQPNGGALLSGGKPGNKGGPGRPPNALREDLRDLLGAHGVRRLARILTNDASEDKDVIAAVNVIARYGLGTKDELTGENGAPVAVAPVVFRMVDEGMVRGTARPGGTGSGQGAQASSSE